MTEHQQIREALEASLVWRASTLHKFHRPVVEKALAALDRLEAAAVPEPNYVDDLELRYAEVCEERDHLRAALASYTSTLPGVYPDLLAVANAVHAQAIKDMEGKQE